MKQYILLNTYRMKSFLMRFCAIITLCAIMGCVNKNADTSDIKLVTAEEMKSILALEDIQLVDVRTPKEYNEKHIPNAQNIDFKSPTFDDDIAKLDKSKPVLLYCKSGRRSAKCSKKLKAAGFEKVYDLDGGISKWEHSKTLQIEKNSSL